MKATICATSVLLALAVVTFVLCSFTSRTETNDVYSEVSCQGKHCTGTVGCGCSGFVPKTDSDEWEKAYCKRCGHHKKYHK